MSTETQNEIMDDIEANQSLAYIAKKYDIQRFGYHGISLESIVNKIKSTGNLPGKIIVCHIGGGVSITAIKDGKSIDTSMGLTPLEGMTMATRVGNIDPGALMYLSNVLCLSKFKFIQFLNKKCGLLGLSNGLSDDVRDLIAAEATNTDAKNALDIYAYNIQKQIGAYVSALGGLDVLVLSGTVGERSSVMREKICSGLAAFGIVLDQQINDASDNIDVVISSPLSRIKVEVIKTDEMAGMAKIVSEL